MKSGFISIIGRPNVGKSTLLNAIIGEKIAIISDKPQTTRNNIIGIYTTENMQMIFTDTPGIHVPKTKLGDYMIKSVSDSLAEVDVVLLVAEPKLTTADEKIIAKFKNSDTPVILILNKIDTLKREALLAVIAEFSAAHSFAAVIPISAKNSDGIDIVVKEIESHLQEGPMYYPEDMMTDQTERQIAAEIIREKLLYLLQDEIPHGTAIEITKMEELPGITNIGATIYCEKKSHKGIIIGKQGDLLKQVGSLARNDIEKMLDKKVYLELWVKVKEDWRNSDFYNRSFGYDPKI